MGNLQTPGDSPEWMMRCEAGLLRSAAGAANIIVSFWPVVEGKG